MLWDSLCFKTGQLLSRIDDRPSSAAPTSLIERSSMDDKLRMADRLLLNGPDMLD
jgi:hypothetical protein